MQALNKNNNNKIIQIGNKQFKLINQKENICEIP